MSLHCPPTDRHTQQGPGCFFFPSASIRFIFCNLQSGSLAPKVMQNRPQRSKAREQSLTVVLPNLAKGGACFLCEGSCTAAGCSGRGCSAASNFQLQLVLYPTWRARSVLWCSYAVSQYPLERRAGPRPSHPCSVRPCSTFFTNHDSSLYLRPPPPTHPSHLSTDSFFPDLSRIFCFCCTFLFFSFLINQFTNSLNSCTIISCGIGNQGVT